MLTDHNFFNYFMHASLVVQGVMLILLGASLVSWTYIVQISIYLRDLRREINSFETLFWHEKNLSQVYADLQKRKDCLCGLQAIFHAGFREFLRLNNKPAVTIHASLESVHRAMNVVAAEEQDDLEAKLPVLATISATSPYIGLFGTVWGIMASFQSLATVQQASIAMVAPGISEALIATAMGLFAAIPAAIAYNRYTAASNRIINRFAAFQESLLNILFYHAQQLKAATPNPSNNETLI